MLKSLVLLNHSYAYEQLKISLHMLLDGLEDHPSVFVIAWLSILTYISFLEKWLIEISKSQHRSLETSLLKHLKGTQSLL